MIFTNQMPEDQTPDWDNEYYTDEQGPDYSADEQDPEEDYTPGYIVSSLLDEQNPEESPDYLENEKSTETNITTCLDEYFADTQDHKDLHLNDTKTTLRNINHSVQVSEDRVALYISCGFSH